MSVQAIVSEIEKKDLKGVRLALLFQAAVSTPNWPQSKLLLQLAGMLGSVFSKGAVENYSGQARAVFKEAQAAYDKKEVFIREKRTPSWRNLPKELLTQVGKYLISTDSLFQEHNFAFFETCKTFHAQRKEVFQRNTDAVNQRVVSDIFARAQYHIEDIPPGFRKLLSIIGKNPSFTRLPFKVLWDYQDVMKTFPHVDSICFSRSQTMLGRFLTDEDILVCSTRAVRVLELHEKSMTHQELVQMLQNSKKSLREIRLYNYQVTDDTIQYLANNHPNLENIIFDSKQRITDKGFSELAKLRQLKSLSLNCGTITDQSVLQIVQHCPLEKLVLTSSLSALERLLPCLGQCTQLSSLALALIEGPLRDVAAYIPLLANISTLKTLRVITLHSVENIDALTRLLHLREMDLLFASSEQICSLVPHFEHLESLVLDNRQLTSEVVSVLQSCPKFRQLGIRWFNHTSIRANYDNNLLQHNQWVILDEERVKRKSEGYAYIKELKPQTLTFWSGLAHQKNSCM
jgi:hypothetical protein